MTEDGELLQRWAAGADEAAFRTLVDRYAGLVHGVAARRAPTEPALVEEIAQNVFLMMARKAAALAFHPSLAGWLHRSAVLECACLRRRQNRYRRKITAFAGQAAGSQDGGFPAAGGLSPPDVDEALSKLGASDREVLLQRFFLEMEYRGIAQVCGTSEAAVRKRVERALAKMAGHLTGRGRPALTAVAAGGVVRTSLSHAAPPGFGFTAGNKVLAMVPAAAPARIFWKQFHVMIQAKTTSLPAAALLALVAFGSSYLLASHPYQSSDPDLSGSPSSVPAPATVGQPAPLEGSAPNPAGAPGDSPERARIRRLMVRIAGGIRVNVRQRQIRFAFDNPAMPGGIDGLRAMAELRDADLAEAWRLLPDFRSDPAGYEGLVMFLTGMKAVQESPRTVMDALLEESLRVKGKPPQVAVEHALRNWFTDEPVLAWNWLQEAVSKGDFPFEERRPVGADMAGDWLAKEPAAALAALAPLGPEWDSFIREALGRALSSQGGRDAVLARLREADDDRLALLTAAAPAGRSDWNRDTLLPWLLTRPWGHGITPAGVVQRWMWKGGQLDLDRFGLLCGAAGQLPTPEANAAVLESVRGVFESSSPESRTKLLDYAMPDPQRRAGFVQLLQLAD